MKSTALILAVLASCALVAQEAAPPARPDPFAPLRFMAGTFRQFHSEGFVNQYLQDPAAGGPDTIVFVTEAIENIPAGWRAKETYRKTGPDTMTETFELAAPGKPFEVYSECRLTRVR